MRRARVGIGRLVAAIALAVSAGAPAAGAEPIAKVTVLASGVVLLDGAPTTLAALEERFRALKAAGGTVWYHRENPGAEPGAQALAVVQLVIRHQLPISMSTKADFSDYVDPQGVSRPRPR